MSQIPTHTTAPPVIPVDDFCHATNMGRRFFYQEVRAGRIQILKMGRRTVVPAGEPARYLASLTTPTV